ncbi:alpha/beta fold hydrolase [Cytobacillus sp. FJAT-54145]|uniref:Alpha/beta fold hydrolase n=1 Tax=Cytobacillus spartinae TaxID=3299023 RepID=A0ABW6KBU4_9BACI
MDWEREKLRWKGFSSIWSKDEPDYALTPRSAIWKKNKTTLWHYPAVNKKYETPLYLIYSLINQPFILDLYPGNSLIEALVNEGFDVYLIDFGIPGYEDKDLTLDNYLVDYIQKGAQKTLAHSQADELTVMGFCLGGTLAAIYTSMATEPIKNLILNVAPIDFGHSGSFDQWGHALRNDEEVSFDEIIDSVGLIPARFIEGGVRLITSPIYFSPYLSLLNRAYDSGYVERWRLFNKWTKGHIPLPGGVLKQLIHEFGKKNSLVNGTLTIRNQPIDLANIHSNLLVVGSTFDRLVPIEQTEKIMELVSSTDKKFHVNKGGHTGLSKNGELPAYMKEWLPERSKPL